MSMGYQGKRRHPLVRSFYFASRGIIEALKTERNIKIHSTVAIIVVLVGLFFSLNWLEWLFILVAIVGTITLELVNSAIERVVDLVTTEYHPLAQQAKDIAAGAVFLYAIFSIIVGIIIFLPKVMNVF
jgi:undecaprenol kinase